MRPWPWLFALTVVAAGACADETTQSARTASGPPTPTVAELDDPAVEATPTVSDSADALLQARATPYGFSLGCPPGSPHEDSVADFEDYGPGLPPDQLDDTVLLDAVQRTMELLPPDAPVHQAELYIADRTPGDDGLVTDVIVAAPWTSSEPDLVGAYFVVTDVGASWEVSGHEACNPFLHQTALGTLWVSQIQTTCCYIEGSLGILEIVDEGGARIAPLASAGPIETTSSGGFESDFEPTTLEPGSYSVRVWQYVCPGGPCSSDPDEWERVAERDQADLCTAEVDIVAGEHMWVVATWTPGQGCDGIEVVG